MFKCKSGRKGKERLALFTVLYSESHSQTMTPSGLLLTSHGWELSFIAGKKGLSSDSHPPQPDLKLTL